MSTIAKLSTMPGGESAVTARTEPHDDLNAFRTHAIAFWAESRAGTAERANAHTDASDAIVRRWVESGTARETLTPMLHDSLVEIQYAAAAHLLKLGDADTAVPVLEELAQTKTSAGMIASAVKFILMKHRNERSSQ